MVGRDLVDERILAERRPKMLANFAQSLTRSHAVRDAPAVAEGFLAANVSMAPTAGNEKGLQVIDSQAF